jgi:peptidoglycan/LPS O-acetylase OafA/YrhL
MGDETVAQQNLAYRPHIDGLRAIAIIAVVLWHANLLGVTGGYVGVDVFFVISGFLITSIIARDLRGGTFSLIGFWERRVRRIIPALVIVMCFCAVASYFLMLYPSDYHHFGIALIAQSMFASNILFMLTTNYFDQSANFSPLLHTWSLSVEEQFYILFPFVVLISLWLAQGRVRSISQSILERTAALPRARVILLALVIALGTGSFILPLPVRLRIASFSARIFAVGSISVEVRVNNLDRRYRLFRKSQRPITALTGCGRSVFGTYFRHRQPAMRHEPRNRLGCWRAHLHLRTEQGGEVQS